MAGISKHKDFNAGLLIGKLNMLHIDDKKLAKIQVFIEKASGPQIEAMLKIFDLVNGVRNSDIINLKFECEQRISRIKDIYQEYDSSKKPKKRRMS